MKFFDWAMRRGQQSAIELDYVPLPDSAVELIGKAWAEQVLSPAGAAVWPDAGTLRR
jgi:phosphate transport system substrate-binding protein